MSLYYIWNSIWLLCLFFSPPIQLAGGLLLSSHITHIYPIAKSCQCSLLNIWNAHLLLTSAFLQSWFILPSPLICSLYLVWPECLLKRKKESVHKDEMQTTLIWLRLFCFCFSFSMALEFSVEHHFLTPKLTVKTIVKPGGRMGQNGKDSFI